MANLTTFKNTSVERIKIQSVSLEKAKKTLIDVYCIEIDINDYLVKNPDGSIHEEVITYTKQKPGGDEYQATLVKRFFKGYPYVSGTVTACNEKGEILLDDNGEPVEQVKIKGSIHSEEFYGEYSFLVQNDKSKADLYIEKVLYPNDEDPKNPIVKHFAYIDVYETEYFDIKSNMNKTALNFQTRVEFISDSKVVNLNNRINKRLAESDKFKYEVGIYKSTPFQKNEDGDIKLFTNKDLI